MHDIKCMQSILCAKLHCLCTIRESCHAALTQELGLRSARKRVKRLKDEPYACPM